MDSITIAAIHASGCHGWTAEERATPQWLRVDVALELDLQRAGETDDLGVTVDYAALHRRIVRIVESSSYALLEKLAAVLLAAIFEDARVVRATLTIGKPDILNGATPAVTLQRDNPRARQ